MLSTILLLLLSFSSPAEASLLELMQSRGDRDAAIVPVAQSPDQNYGVDLLSRERFAELTELSTPEELENPILKLVEGESDQVLSTGDIDGDNVLYHLSRAREYFSSLASSAIERKVTVRLRMKAAFDPAKRFSSSADFNHSRYIPAERTGKWDPEIWFDARRGRLEEMDWYDMGVDAGHGVWQESWLSFAVSGPIQMASHFNRGLDGAKIPSVVYHEAFHWATDREDFFPGISEDNPVAEIYADYFGSSLNNRPAMADIEEFSSRFFSRDYSKIPDLTKHVSPSNADLAAFCPSLFWKVRDLLGAPRADRLFWRSIPELYGSAHVTDIPPALQRAARLDTELSAAEVEEIEKVLADHFPSIRVAENKLNPPKPGAAPASPTPSSSPSLAAPKSLVGKIEHRGVSVAEEMGYTGTALNSVAHAPLTFGADLVTSILFGDGVHARPDSDLTRQFVGSGGALGVEFGTYAALGNWALELASPMGAVGSGFETMNEVICYDVDPHGSSQRSHYCLESHHIAEMINGAIAGAGARIGAKIHVVIVGMIDEIKKLMTHPFFTSPLTS